MGSFILLPMHELSWRFSNIYPGATHLCFPVLLVLFPDALQKPFLRTLGPRTAHSSWRHVFWKKIYVDVTRAVAWKRGHYIRASAKCFVWLHIRNDVISISGDAYHITAPSEDGRGAALAMRSALRDGGLEPSDIHYINAHATSTPLGKNTCALFILKCSWGHNMTWRRSCCFVSRLQH